MSKYKNILKWYIYLLTLFISVPLLDFNDLAMVLRTSLFTQNQWPFLRHIYFYKLKLLLGSSPNNMLYLNRLNLSNSFLCFPFRPSWYLICYSMFNADESHMYEYTLTFIFNFFWCKQIQRTQNILKQCKDVCISLCIVQEHHVPQHKAHPLPLCVGWIHQGASLPTLIVLLHQVQWFHESVSIKINF